LRRIAVIIPTLNEDAIIASTLAQFDTLPGRWEIIIADSGSQDGTRAIAAMHGARVVNGPPGRGAGMNAGAAVATSDTLLFLHADTSLPPDAYELILAGLEDPAVAATAFRLTMDGDSWRYRLIPYVSRLRVRIQRTFFGDQAIAVRRADFDRIGGYPEPFLMEDVALSRRLRREGKLRMLPGDVVTSSRRFDHGGMVWTLVFMSCLQVAYSLGVSANRLARLYRHVR
jgi:rSAM/selenodomain-associated transferase 2